MTAGLLSCKVSLFWNKIEDENEVPQVRLIIAKSLDTK